MNTLYDAPIQQSSGVVLGTASVLGIKYNDGVLIAADTLGSYGSMALFRDLDRVVKVGNFSVMAASGEYSDFEEVNQIMQKKVLGDETHEGRSKGLEPKELFSYLQRHLYHKRCEVKPLYTSCVFGGMKKGEIFLGQTDMYGTAFEENYVATGIGAHMAMPLLRKEWQEGMDRQAAELLLAKCMKILYLNHFDSEGPEIVGPINISTEGKWDIMG
ncbi:Proteasome subunit beta [Entamoeba marina]